MLFYTIIVSMEEAEEPVRSWEAPEDKELAGKLLACSEANYRQNGQYYYFFATGIKRTRIQFGAVFKSATDVLPAFSVYLQEAGMAAVDISIQETAFTAFRVMLKIARAKELIRDDEEVLRRFELDRLRSNYGEALIEGNQTKEALMRQSRAMLCEETLLPELRRIYTKKRRRAEEQLGLQLHEVLHIANLHAARKGNRQHWLWNVACDMAINAQIEDCGRRCIMY